MQKYFSSAARAGVWGLAPIKERRGGCPLRSARYRGGPGCFLILCHRKFCFCPCQEATQSRRPVTLTFTPQTPSPRIAYKCRHSPRSQPLSPHQPPTLWNASAFALPQSRYSFISSSQRARSFDETRSPSIAVHPISPSPSLGLGLTMAASGPPQNMLPPIGQVTSVPNMPPLMHPMTPQNAGPMRRHAQIGSAPNVVHSAVAAAPPSRPPPPPLDTMRAYRACLNCRNRKSKCDLDINGGRPVSVSF